MKILIGTKSPPKVAAIEEALEKCVYFNSEEMEMGALKVSSDISDMPLSIEENMLGAKNRAENCKKEEEADFYVGMEGGTTKIGEKAYLFGVVYVLNNSGEGHYGFSNMMEVPEQFEKRIYEGGEELGVVLGQMTGVSDASKKEGSMGHWSDYMFDRKDEFLKAFLGAISPFYNKYYK